MYVCSCFGITDKQVKEHAAAGACTPRQIASATKAGTDCGSCVRTIQGLLGRGACPRRELLEKGDGAAVLAADSRLVPAVTAAVAASAVVTAGSGSGPALAEAA
ncbi:bacterioferritin-associated ferredoxin [Streptomyces lavendulae]|uniref:(2Fe-2S)-binding protein n=1 Tax=Streptomyces lavendulae TaxID=1914 RepID=UPI0036794D22